MPVIVRTFKLVQFFKPHTFVISKFSTSILPKIDNNNAIHQINLNESIKKYKIKRPKFNLHNIEKSFDAVKAFATAEEYNLEKLWNFLKNDNTYISSIKPDALPDVLHVKKVKNASENHSIFFFRDGVTVFWNSTDIEIKYIIEKVKEFSTNAYEQSLVENESDTLDFRYHESSTKFQDGKIFLQNKNINIFELYTFSNSLSQSVKLAIWENCFDKLAESIEKLVEELKCNVITITEKEILQKAGELFALRHLVNLSSDLLDSPDFYWDRDNLEIIYCQVCSYLNIPRRIRVINEKLNHCCDIVNLLKTSLNDKHHIRLEWMIIILILVEVFLGLLTTYKIYEPTLLSTQEKDENISKTI